MVQKHANQGDWSLESVRICGDKFSKVCISVTDHGAKDDALRASLYPISDCISVCQNNCLREAIAE